MNKILLCLIFLLPLDHAQAYVDPGTGSLVVQVLLAFIFGALFTLKQWWGFVVSLFSKKSTVKDTVDSK